MGRNRYFATGVAMSSTLGVVLPLKIEMLLSGSLKTVAIRHVKLVLCGTKGFLDFVAEEGLGLGWKRPRAKEARLRARQEDIPKTLR